MKSWNNWALLLLKIKSQKDPHKSRKEIRLFRVLSPMPVPNTLLNHGWPSPARDRLVDHKHVTSLQTLIVTDSFPSSHYCICSKWKDTSFRSTSDAEPKLKLIRMTALKPEVIHFLPNPTDLETLNQEWPNDQKQSSFSLAHCQPDIGRDSG